MNSPYSCESCFFFRETDDLTFRPVGERVKAIATKCICALRPPTGSRGFPETAPNFVCALFTDAETREQPLKRHVAYLATADDADGAKGGGGNG